MTGSDRSKPRKAERQRANVASWLLIGLLLWELCLFLCDHLGRCGFGDRKGWAVLIATASMAVGTLVFLLMLAASLLTRQRLQFNIRALLLLMAAIAIPCGWLKSSMKQAERQQATVKFLSSSFNVHYSVSPARKMIPIGVGISMPAPPAPEWLLEWLGEDFFLEVEQVHNGFSRIPLTDADLSALCEFRQLKRLHLSFNDNHPSAIEVPKPHRPDGGRPLTVRPHPIEPVSLAGFRRLGELNSLEELSFTNGWHITDEGLECISQLRNLKSLTLSNMPQVNNAGLQCLSALGQLEELSLYGLTQISDDGLKPLAELRQLRTLNLDGVKISDTGVQGFAGLKRLEILSLNATRVTDAAMPELGRLLNLRALHLGSTKVTDAGLQHLGSCRRLKLLVLRRTSVGNAGLAHLGTLAELAHLNLVATKVSDAGLHHLKQFPQLTQLLLTGSKVTAAGRAELKTLPQFANADFDKGMIEFDDFKLE